jgi:hypothetical protein
MRLRLTGDFLLIFLLDVSGGSRNVSDRLKFGLESMLKDFSFMVFYKEISGGVLGI